MRVLHILEATAGGTRRHVLDLLLALARRGHECSLIYSALRNPHFEQDAAALRAQNIQTWNVPMSPFWDAAIDAKALWQLREILHKSTFDVIHAHSSKAGFLGRMAAAGAGSAVVYTPHCISLQTHLPQLRRRLARYAECAAAPFTDHYIAVSQAEKRRIVQAGLSRKSNVTVIHNGIETTQDVLAPAPGSTLRLGCVGRMSDQKNQQFAIRLLHLLRQRQVEVTLALVGQGSYSADLRQQARRLGVEDAVIWRGFQESSDEIYGDIDVLLAPSRWEGCSYAILEAMNLGLPVLASDVGANPQLLPHSAQVQPLQHPHQWICVLKQWQNPRLRQAVGKANRQHLQKYFSLQQMVEATLGVYESVVVHKK